MQPSEMARVSADPTRTPSGKKKLLLKGPMPHAKHLRSSSTMDNPADKRIVEHGSSELDSLSPRIKVGPNPDQEPATRSTSSDLSSVEVPCTHQTDGRVIKSREIRMEEVFLRKSNGAVALTKKKSSSVVLRVVFMLCMLVVVGVAAIGGLYYGCAYKPVQDLAREAGVLKSLVGLLREDRKLPVVVTMHLLQRLGTGNAHVKGAMVEYGVLPSLVSILQQDSQAQENKTDKISCLEMLGFLIEDVPEHRDALLSGGLITVLVDFIGKESDPELTVPAVKVLAVLMATEDPIYRDSFMANGGVSALVKMLEAGPDAAESAVAGWALANAVHGKSDNISGNSDAIDALVRLMWSGPNELVTSTSLVALANMAVGNLANQDRIREGMGLEAVVKLLEETGDYSASQISEGINIDLIKKVAATSGTNSLVRVTLSEMAKGDNLIRLVLPEEEESGRKLPENKHAVAMVSERNLTDNQALSVVDGVQLLNEMLQEMSAGIEDGDKVMHQKHEAVTSRLLRVNSKLPMGLLAERAAWAIGAMVTSNAESQEAVRKVGGVELLLRILESAADTSPSTAASVAQALSAIASGHRENCIAIRRAKGVELGLHILSLHTHEELTNSVANMLEIMVEERLVDRLGPMEAAGEWISTWVWEMIGVNIRPLAAIILVLCVPGVAMGSFVAVSAGVQGGWVW